MRQTARALIINEQGLCFLAVHNHFRPENIGKWGTVGGLVDPTDLSIEDCLRRELQEEFLGISQDSFKVGVKVDEIVLNNTLHHFFEVHTVLTELTVAQPQEVLQTQFFSLDEVKELQAQGRLYFGKEADLFESFLQKTS